MDYRERITLEAGKRSGKPCIRRGNCSTTEIESILRSRTSDIQTLLQDSTLGILTLY